jgi:hypothetical protein
MPNYKLGSGTTKRRKNSPFSDKVCILTGQRANLKKTTITYNLDKDYIKA